MSNNKLSCLILYKRINYLKFFGGFFSICFVDLNLLLLLFFWKDKTSKKECSQSNLDVKDVRIVNVRFFLILVSDENIAKFVNMFINHLIIILTFPEMFHSHADHQIFLM